MNLHFLVSRIFEYVYFRKWHEMTDFFIYIFQVLITEESNSVSEKVSHLIPQIQSILKAKWTNEQAETLEGIFEQLTK